MATYLPAGIVKRKEYFHMALRFLVRYEWLYNFPVTEILSSGLLDQLPYEWWQVLQNLTVEELNGIPRGEFKDSWPISLKQFIVTALRLRLPIADQPVPPGAPIPGRLRHALVRGMSPKKMHEVTRLAGVVADICARAKIGCIVDMGCGLGYLCEVLHFVFGFRVVGLESDPAKVARAKERHANTCRMLRVQDESGVRYVECDVTDNTEPVVRALSQELDANGQPAPFCLVGLHSCGDLTPHAVHLFHRIEQITQFVLVTCCYHKMEVDQSAAAAAACVSTAESASQAALAEQSRRADPGADRDRERKARLVLQWLLRWGRPGDAGASPLQEKPTPQDPQDPLHASDVYSDETQRAGLSSMLVEWLGPRGTLLTPRRPPAPEHFFKFPLSQELRALARCGAKRLQPATLGPENRRRSASAGRSLTRSISRACPRLSGCCTSRTRKRCGGQVRSCSVDSAPDGGAVDDPSGDCAQGDGPVDARAECARGPGDASAEDAVGAAHWFGPAGLWGCQFLRRPFLRLASNETVVSWECRPGPVHTTNSIHMMTRAVFQLYAASNNLTLAQRGACLLHNMQLGMSSREILADIVDRLLPSLSEEERARHKKSLAFLYAALDPMRPLLEAIIGLQVALQHVCEGLILVDRLAALAQDVPNVGILRVADPYFSPRCYALVAEKETRAPQQI